MNASLRRPSLKRTWDALYSFVRDELGSYTLRVCSPENRARQQRIYTTVADLFGQTAADRVFQEWRDRRSAEIPTWAITDLCEGATQIPGF